MVNTIGGCEYFPYPAESCFARWAVGEHAPDELCPRCAELRRLALADSGDPGPR